MKLIYAYTIVTIVVVLFLVFRTSNNNNHLSLRLKLYFHHNHQLQTDQEFHHTKLEMIVYDKYHNGFVSFSKFGLSQYADGGDEMRLLAEERFYASDEDENGLLNFAEFKDFLHPANSKNPKLQQWLFKEEVSKRDTDRDGKVNFIQFFYGAYDGESYKDSTDKVLFSQLDKDGDGYLSDIELLSKIGKLHPSGQYYAMKQAEYFNSQTPVDKDGHLNLPMRENAYAVYASSFHDE